MEGYRMNQSELKKFAQNTRRKLIRQIESRLDYVLNHDDPYLRAHEKEKSKIKGLLDKKGKEQLVEETAYIWFNRFTALWFMDKVSVVTRVINSTVDAGLITNSSASGSRRDTSYVPYWSVSYE